MFRRWLVPIAIFLLFLAIMMTGLGGSLDILTHNLQITKEHAWNDGIFLVTFAIALLLLSLL